MRLDEGVICFQSPGGCLRLAESINLILWLKGSDFVVEFKNLRILSHREDIWMLQLAPSLPSNPPQQKIVQSVFLNLGLHHTSLQCQL